MTTKTMECSRCGEKIPITSKEHKKCGWSSTYTVKTKPGRKLRNAKKPETPATAVETEGSK